MKKGKGRRKGTNGKGKEKGKGRKKGKARRRGREEKGKARRRETKNREGKGREGMIAPPPKRNSWIRHCLLLAYTLNCHAKQKQKPLATGANGRPL
jgi:hypothetical protein